jgi:hypothetical protein
MKKTLLYTIASISLLATSCQEKHEIEYTDLGSEFFISDGGYTSLDDRATLLITNQQKNLSSVEVLHLGGLTTDEDANGDPIPFPAPSGDLGKIDLSDEGTGSVVYTSDQLGMTEMGWEAFIQFDASINGKPFARTHSITVSNPNSMLLLSSNIKKSEPANGFFYVEEFKSINDTINKGEKDEYYLPTGVIEEHKVNVLSETATSKIETAVTSTKIGENGVYTEVLNDSPASLEYNSKFDYTIGAYGDTTYVRLETGANGRTATEIAKIVITGKSFDYSDSGNLTTSKPDSVLYRVETAKDVFYTLGDIKLSGLKISSTTVKFKKSNADTPLANLSEVVQFIGTGGELKPTEDVMIGDKYAFHFSGKNEDARDVVYYGVITIIDVTTDAIGDLEKGFVYSYTMTEKEVN